MIDEPPGRFLMTSAQHRQWALLARRDNREDLAQQHEQLARLIERREQSRLQMLVDGSRETEAR